MKFGGQQSRFVLQLNNVFQSQAPSNFYLTVFDVLTSLSHSCEMVAAVQDLLTSLGNEKQVVGSTALEVGPQVALKRDFISTWKREKACLLSTKKHLLQPLMTGIKSRSS